MSRGWLVEPVTLDVHDPPVWKDKKKESSLLEKDVNESVSSCIKESQAMMK